MTDASFRVLQPFVDSLAQTAKEIIRVDLTELILTK